MATTKQQVLDKISQTLVDGVCGTISPANLRSLLTTILDYVDTQDADAPAGNDGVSPHIDTNGDWFIGETDTGIPAKGTDGDNGLTPTIGENGNWFIGTTDTGVKARGIDGDNGETPSIDPETDEWIIGGVSTGVSATGTKGDKGNDGDDGTTPSIDPSTGNWSLAGVDTGVRADYTRQIDYNADIVGTRSSGAGGVFTASKAFVPGSIAVYLDGLRLTKGNAADYVETDNQRVTINRAISVDNILMFDYLLKNIVT